MTIFSPLRWAPIGLLYLLTLSCTSEINVTQGTPGHGTITVLDSGGEHGDTGWWPSIALDGEDRPHLSYCDRYRGNLHYATKIDGTWQNKAIISDGKVGKYTSLGVAQDGTVGISFYDQGQLQLRYTWKSVGDDWKSENIAWGLEVGMASELRFDANNQPHVFYYLPSGKLIHAMRNTQGKWTKQLVYEATGGFTVRIDPHLRQDGIWLSFVDWGFKDLTLLLGQKSTAPNASFQVETIFEREGPGWRSQLIFPETQPTPFLLYSLNFKRTLQIARKQNNKWKSDILLRNAGNFVAQTIKNGGIVVAAESLENPKLMGGTLQLLRKSGDKWTKYPLDLNGPNASQLSMATTQRGEVIIAYYSKLIRGLKIYDETETKSPPIQN